MMITLYLLSILKESSPTDTENVSLQWKITFYSENTENENTHFISSGFSNKYIIKYVTEVLCTHMFRIPLGMVNNYFWKKIKMAYLFSI